MQMISEHTLSATLMQDGSPVVVYRIDYPQFTSTCCSEAAAAISSFYYDEAKAKEEYCRSVLYRQAVADRVEMLKNNFPFHPYEFYISYVITYNSDCITSLYLDQYMFTGGAHGQTIRTSQTWDFASGNQLMLDHFFPRQALPVEQIKKQLDRQVASRLKQDPATYFDDYSQLISQTFRPENYYLTPYGVMIYFQQYDIAPYSTGIPEFLLPFVRK